MKLLILFPNATNWAVISTAIPILAGIAKNRNWELSYFDTHRYKDQTYVKIQQEQSKNAGFKSGYVLYQHSDKLMDELIPDLQKRIDDFNPDLIAITALSNEYKFLLSFWPKIKIPKNTKTIIGGMHATVKPDDVINTKLFDLVALGEGEGIFQELLHKLESHYPIYDIKGTYFYDKDYGWDVVIKNSKRPLLHASQLWEVGNDFSFYDDTYFLKSFDGKENRRYEVEISRGCPYNCAYCGNSTLKKFNQGLGKYVKTRPIDSSIKQMKKILEKFKIDIFTFTDECFFAHPFDWLEEFMTKYKIEINKPFILMTRAETITEKNIKMMLKYNIPFQVSLGVESGSEKILQEVCDRTCTNEKVIDAFKILDKNRIRVNAFFIVGFPFETRADVFKSIELCKKIKPSVVSLAVFQPYPGQKLTDICIEQGFMDKDEIPGIFASDSLLKMPAPYLSTEEIKEMWRVFMLYAMLPKKFWKNIEKCEKDYYNNQELYDNLVKLRWEKYNFAIKKKEKKLV